MTLSEKIQFERHFVDSLPADPEKSNSIRQVFDAAYSWVQPTPVSAPSLVAFSREMAETLNLGPEVISSDQFLQVMSGNDLYEGMSPFAMNYGGHQFGNWAGQLGDGRAINSGRTSGC